MIRTAKVLKVERDAITFELVRTPNCIGCPINCNRPLVDFFGLHNQTFSLSFEHPEYDLTDPEQALSQNPIPGQQIKMQIDTQDVMYSSAWLYLWPLFCAMVGLVVGYGLGAIWQAENLFAVVSMLLSLYFSQPIKKLFLSSKGLKFRPKVTILSVHGTQAGNDSL